MSAPIIDTPQFLDTDHPIENRADAEAYLSRLAQYPGQLDGELARMRAARAQGLVPPNFLIDKAIDQIDDCAEELAEGGTLVDSLVKRTKEKGIAGDWAARARKIAVNEVAPALQRQIDELRAGASNRHRCTPACGRARTATNTTAGPSRRRQRRT